MRSFCCVYLGLWFALAAPAPPCFAAVWEATPPSAGGFEVVPAEHPAVRTKAGSTTKIRPILLIKSEGVSDVIRQGYIRAAACAGLGALGMIFIGFRLYGRRQGKAAT